MPSYDLTQSIRFDLRATGREVPARIRDDVAGLARELAELQAQLERGQGAERESAAALADLAARFQALAATVQSSGQASARADADRARATKAAVDSQVDDWQRLQDALQRMEARDQSGRGQAVQDPRVAQAVADAAEVYDTWASLQARLKQMDRESADAAKQGAAEVAASRRRGTEAVADHIAQVRAEAAEVERARVAEVQAMGDRARAYARAEQDAEEYEAAVRRIADASTRDANARTWIDKQQADLDELLAEMHEYERVAKTVQVNAGATASAGAKGAKDAAGATKEWNGQLLSVAYAFDDIRYGFGAIVNNVPQIALATGMTAAWAGGIAIAAVAIDTLSRNFGPSMEEIKVGLGIADDKTRMLARSVEDAKAKLDALKAQSYKVDIDYTRIREAEVTLDAMEKRLAAFKAAERDNIQETTAKQTKDIAGDFGGSAALQKIVGDIYASQGVSFTTAETEAAIAKATKQIKQFENYSAIEQLNPIAIYMYNRAKENLAAAQQQAMEQNANAARDEVGAFNAGDYEAIKRMQRRARDFPGAFNAVGPENLTLGERVSNLASSRGEAIGQFDAEKSIAEGEKELAQFEQRNRTARTKAQQNARAKQAEQQRAINEAATGYADRDNLQSGLFQKAAGGQVPANVQADMLAAVKANLVKAGTDPGLIEAAAAEIMKDAMVAVNRHLASGTQPAGVRREEQAGRAGRRQFNQEAAAMARRVGPGIMEDVENRILGGIANGATPEQAADAVAAAVGQWVRAQGVRGEQSEQVANAIIDKATGATATALAKLGGPNQQAAAQVLEDRIRKLEARAQAADRQGDSIEARNRQQVFGQEAQARFGANDAQAEQIGRRANQWLERGANPEQALQAAIRELLAGQQQAWGRLQRLENFGWNVANQVRIQNQRQNRNVNQMPAVGMQGMTQ